MSLIAGSELFEIIEKGYLDALPENVNAASIDIRIGDEVLIEAIPEMEGTSNVIDIDAKESQAFTKVKIGAQGILIHPGQFFLAHSMETFNLPNNLSSQFILRSTVARSGLNHLMAGWADAGFNGAQLTFEFKNENEHHSVLLKPGMRVGQMIFSKHADAGDLSYSIKGNYNGQQGATMAYGMENKDAS